MAGDTSCVWSACNVLCLDLGANVHVCLVVKMYKTVYL